MLLLLTSLLISHGTAAADMCADVMSAAGINPADFAPMITHSIHSLTLDDIRYYFKEDAPEENFIPTVNPDMEAEERVLVHAPLVGYDEDFSTPAMRQFDMVLRNMDRADWQVRGYSPLEQATHVFHMAELWNQASEQYKLAQKLLDPQSPLCGCLSDVQSNGIWQNMNLMALKIRYPGITSGNDTLTATYLTSRAKRAASRAYKISYGLEMQAQQMSVQHRLAEFDFSASDVEILGKVASELVDGSGIMEEELDSAEHWDYWKEHLKTAMREDLYYDLGLFMFCMLN